MTLVLVEVADEAAMQRLRLQSVRVVGVVAEPAAVEIQPEQPAPRKWAGSIPAASAEAWDKHVQEIRGEWDRDM